jgi:CheY-like chemotaxis protein
MRAAKIPAARPLQQIPADRSHVPQLRRRGQAVPVILISGDTGHIHGAERFGPHFAVLSKPFKLADLFERFESLRAAALNRV